MLQLKHGDPIQIYRPHKNNHGWLGRYVEPGPDASLAYVAFNTSKEAKPTGSQLPELKHLSSQVRCPRVLFPLSQIERYEPA